MTKSDIAKIIAILIIPGGIPIWLGYKLYKKAKDDTSRVREDSDQSKINSNDT